MIDAKHAANIQTAINAQAEDHLLWQHATIVEAYIIQSLRWLHAVVEDNDPKALASIVEQSEENQ